MRLGEGGKDVLCVFVGVYVKRERETETEREELLTEIQSLGCRHFSFKTFFYNPSHDM